MLEMREALIEAIRNCDMLGMFPPDHPHPRQAKAADVLGRLGLLAGKTLVRASVHLQLAWRERYRTFLSGLPRLGLIGCRPIAEAIKSAFGIGEVHFWPVPQESQHQALAGGNSVPFSVPHWPDRYRQIMQELQVERGQPFLVGAGHLGKAYCDLVKRKGGIAIDVGSLMDAWAGVPSRARGRAFGNIQPLQVTP
jgi:hypothetical protein